MIKIIVPGNPKSDNHLYGHRAFGKRVIRYMTKVGKDYKKLAASIAFNKYPVLATHPTNKELFVRIEVFFGDKRKRDVQGHLKAVIDSFEGVLYDNDTQIIELHAKKHYDKENPRTEISIWKMEDLK